MKEELIEKIIKTEWRQFDRVQNEGGRAECQDDWNTFYIMRKSQYLAWTDELLESYYKDLQSAEEAGWNLITEKYARMMESTAPDKYEKLKERLIKRSKSRLDSQEEIIKIQVKWMEEFAEKYPHVGGRARSIHTYDDTPYNTSYETYLRGELGTYSDNTFYIYKKFIIKIKEAGESLAYHILNNTIRLSGYKSLEDAERKLGTG